MSAKFIEEFINEKVNYWKNLGYDVTQDEHCENPEVDEDYHQYSVNPTDAIVEENVHPFILKPFKIVFIRDEDAFYYLKDVLGKGEEINIYDNQDPISWLRKNFFQKDLLTLPEYLNTSVDEFGTRFDVSLCETENESGFMISTAVEVKRTHRRYFIEVSSSLFRSFGYWGSNFEESIPLMFPEEDYISYNEFLEKVAIPLIIKLKTCTDEYVNTTKDLSDLLEYLKYYFKIESICGECAYTKE